MSEDTVVRFRKPESVRDELLGRGPFHGVVRRNTTWTPRDDRLLRQSATLDYLTIRRKLVQSHNA